MFQQVIVVGNLGTDPELRYMPDGSAVCNFSVATNKRWTDKATGEPVEQTTWFRVSVWGAQAENVNQYLEKGRQCMVVGELNPDKATGGPRIFSRQDGSVGASYELRAFTVRFLAGGRDDNGGSHPGSGTARQQIEEDEIPF